MFKLSDYILTSASTNGGDYAVLVDKYTTEIKRAVSLDWKEIDLFLLSGDKNEIARQDPDGELAVWLEQEWENLNGRIKDPDLAIEDAQIRTGDHSFQETLIPRGIS